MAKTSNIQNNHRHQNYQKTNHMKDRFYSSLLKKEGSVNVNAMK